MASDFETRKQALLDECDVDAKLFNRVLPRLKAFMKPFVECFVRKEQIEQCADAGARIAVGCGAQERGNDRLPLWSRADAVAVVYRGVGLGIIGRCKRS